MNNRFSIFSYFLIVFSLIAFSTASAQYVKADQLFTAGQTTTIHTNGAKQLNIIYRPGSNISQTKTVKVTAASYEWVPQKAGIFAITTPNGPSQTVSVSFGSFPVIGLIVLLVAGSILFGGATFAAVNLFGDSSAKAR